MNSISSPRSVDPRRPLWTGVVAAVAAAAALACGTASAQEKTLRIAMTAADIPRTLGQPDQGFEGNRFTGIPIYDALTQWTCRKPTRRAC